MKILKQCQCDVNDEQYNQTLVRPKINALNKFNKILAQVGYFLFVCVRVCIYLVVIYRT